VAQLEWSGQAELTELDSVRALHPALRRLLERWRLSGQLAGAWSLNQDGAGDFQSRLAMGPDSQLNVAGAFAKPPGVSMELRIGALLDLHAPFVRAGRAELSCGRGHLELRLTDVTRDGNDPASAAVAHGNFRGDSLEDFVRCLMIAGPPAAQGDDADAPPPAAAAGGNAAAPQAAIPLAGAITGEFVAHVGSDLALLHADADATELALWNAATALKAPGEGAWAALDLRWERPAGLLTGQANLRAEAAEAKLNLQFQREAWSAQLDATLRDAAWLSRRLPLAAAGHKLNLDGTGTLSAHVDGRDGALTATISAEGRDLGIAVDGVPAGKPRGDPLSFSATGRLFEDENGPALQLTTIDLAAGPLALEGTAKVHLAAAPTVQCSGVLKAALGPELGRLSPLLRPVISLLGLSGAMQAGVNVDWAAGQDLRAAVELDATGLAVAPVVVPIRKPAGKPATLKAEVRFHPQLAQVDVDNLQGQLGPIQAQGSSTIFLHPLRCQGRLSARMDDAAPLADFSPLLADLAPAGGFACSSEFTADASTIRVRQLSLQLDNLRGRWQGQEVSIGGAVRVEDAALALLPHPQPAVGAVRTDNLHIRAAEQDLTLVLDLHDLLAGPKGQITLLADRIDSARLDALKPHQNLPAKVDEAYRQRLMRQVSAIIAQVAERLRGCDLHIRADIAQVHDWLDPRTDHRCDVQELSVRGSIVDGRIDATIASGVNGGTFLAQVQTDLREPSPQLTFTNQIRDMTSTDALNAQVAELFPDNHVLGTLWREMTLHMPVEQAAAELVDPRVKSHPVGSGVAHMNRGVVSGRAAPRFVTAVFPGLNLVAYSYDQMVAFSDYHADGSAANDMVFSAPDYDMYIEGLTGADHIGHYEIGLILLGSQQSPEWNHRFRQGRVPVLRFSAGLVHGHKVNEEISYLWPNQSAFSMFLKNNYFYRLWLERQKRGQATNGKPESR
jgi:hypothetical protein